MLINCCYLHLNLLIFAFLIHFSNSNCNWLRIGISEIRLPQSDYIRQYNPRQSRASQSRKMNHSINDNSHPHRKPFASTNSSIAKYFDYGEESFVNDVTGLAQSPEALRQLEEYDAILSQFSSAQLKFLKKNPNSLGVLSEGTSLAIQQCAERFSRERWNCSIEDENELFAQTLRRGNRESAFLQAIVSAGITYSLTQACSRGHLENCACDYSQYERFSDIELARRQNTNQRVWHWAGCSDNLAFGIRLSKQFLDGSSSPSKRRPGLKEMMNLHNNRAGREAIKKLMRLKCRCHGSSGSCQLKTCWRVLPNFDEIGKYLKKKYLQSVRIQGIVNHGSTFRLKRSRRASDLFANELSDLPSALSPQVTELSPALSPALSPELSPELSTALSKSAPTRRLEESAVFDPKFEDRKIRRFAESDAASSAIRSRRSVQSTNRVVSSQFNGIEMGSNSFVVNKLNEKELDQDDDYEDYVENDLEEELEKSKLTAATNRVFSGKQSREVTGRQNDEPARQVNKSDSSKAGSVDKEPIGRRTAVGGQSEANGNRIEKSSAKTARTNRKQATRQAADPPPANKQVSSPTNRQANRQAASKPIGNFNGLGIEIENMIRNVVSNSDEQDASSFRSPDKQELVYAYDSPNYCTASSYLKILGTANRSCRKVKRKHSDSCDSLCCGRGYDKRIVHKSEECQCEFDAVSVGVKCKTCEFALETFTCK